MSSIPSVPELERRMRPGVWSRGGFLGRTESLEAVLIADRATLEEARVTHDQLANALEGVLQSALDQKSRMLSQLNEESAKFRHKPGKLRTALEIALPPPPTPEYLRLSSEYEKRDVQMPDLLRPESIPRFSLDNLPDPELGYLVEGALQVFFLAYRGLQECPWGCAYHPWAYFDFLILNRQSGEYVTGPGLIVHLIREHQFFEGAESPYRLDPAKAIRVLELPSGLASL